jgi:hypothetical protein
MNELINDIINGQSAGAEIFTERNTDKNQLNEKLDHHKGKYKINKHRYNS